jgi:hypothetical protein
MVREKYGRTSGGAARAVDQAPEDREKPGNSVHLIEDNQSIQISLEILLGFRESGAILCRFQIEIQRRNPLSNLQRKRCFPYLARPRQTNSRRLHEPCRNRFEQIPIYHPCKSGSLLPDLQG